MPGKHKDPTISFRASAWERTAIEQRAALSGMNKKDFIIRSCIYANIVVVGKKENVQRIVAALWEMQTVMKETARQLKSGGFPMSDASYLNMKRDYLALTMAVVDIVNGAAYLFGKEVPDDRKKWKMEQELEEYRLGLERIEEGEI